MKRTTRTVWLVLAAIFVCAGVVHSGAQKHRHDQGNVAVVMLSDIHFDPYQDPAKFPLLRTSPVSEWEHILAMPASAKQVEEFAALQKACNARGADSSWGVLAGSLRAARAQQPMPLFVTVSGDLLTHGFDCRFRSLMHGASGKDIEAFAEKTVAFVALQLREAFPKVPVFLALGNNDSGCTDYEDEPGSDFLQSAGDSFAADIPESRDSKDVVRQFGDEGDYNVALPEPMQHTRLIVLQDIFESRLYRGCGSQPDAGKAAAAQIVWLQAQLAETRLHHEHAWVMAHIPPGVDVYSSFHKYVLQPERICEVSKPIHFLNSEALADTLTSFADVVSLAIFAHTHMDEMKLLHGSGPGSGSVPVKLVPSISPVNGNHPAFLVAQVDPETATLMDYSEYVAHGLDAGLWGEAYRYSRVYQMPDYSAASVQQLTAKLAADPSGDGDASRAYQKWFYAGDVGLFGLGLHQIWPAYACGIVETGDEAFHRCMCAASTVAK